MAGASPGQCQLLVTRMAQKVAGTSHNGGHPCILLPAPLEHPPGFPKHWRPLVTPQCLPCLWHCLGVGSEEMKSVQCKDNLQEELSCRS